jgi:S-adenosylmethionine synthetase
MQTMAYAVLDGHPNRLCDLVAEAIVDECLRRDPKSAMGVRVLGGRGAIMVSGEWVSRAEFDGAQFVRMVCAEAGAGDVEPFVHVGIPQPVWAQAREKGVATETVVAKGYATRSTREQLPPGAVFAHDLVRRLREARLHNAAFSWLGADGFVWVESQGNHVKHLGVQVQHAEGIGVGQVQSELFERVLRPMSGGEGVQYRVNAQGPFTTGGFAVGCGQSGVEDYLYAGLLALRSGVGTDGAHVRRAGNAMARFLAKEYLAASDAKQVWVQLTYVPGLAEPVSSQVLADGKDVSEWVKGFDLRLQAIAERLDLCKPRYRRAVEHGPLEHDASL